MSIFGGINQKYGTDALFLGAQVLMIFNLLHPITKRQEIITIVRHQI